MSMKMIRSITTICDNILSYNVTLDYPLYSSATTYGKGDKVVDTACGANVYESVANANTGKSITDTSWWVNVGTSNYYAMFDNKTGSQTQRESSIEVEVSFDSLVNSVALINVSADNARFEAWDQFDEKVIDFVVELRDYGSNSWYEYLYGEISFKDRYVSFDVPTIVGGRGKLTLSSENGIAKLGSLVYGSQFEIGTALWGASFSIKDYSIKEQDDFGNYIIVPRSFSDRLDIPVLIEHSKLANVRRIMTEYRTEPALYSAGDDYDVLVTFGYYRDLSVILSSPAGADCNLQIEGVI